MVGNATEEAILKDLKHPSHRDRPVWPLAIALAMLVSGWWISGVLRAWNLAPWLTVLIAAALLVPAGLAVGMIVRRYGRRGNSAGAEADSDARAAREDQLAAQIAAARASGAFDKWESRQGKQR